MDLDNSLLLVGVLLFGIIALVAAAGARIAMKSEFDVYFVKLFGLLFIGTLAVAIVFIELDSDARTGAYTILGTIAGYLAGSKVPEGAGAPGKEAKGGDRPPAPRRP